MTEEQKREFRLTALHIAQGLQTYSDPKSLITGAEEIYNYLCNGTGTFVSQKR